MTFFLLSIDNNLIERKLFKEEGKEAMAVSEIKNVLIIRSASFQQLDNNFPKLIKTFPKHKFHMLTHEHGVKLAEKYEKIDQLFVYPYKKSFSIWRRVPALSREKFDIVIIPVSNLTGRGFLNVVLFSFAINASQRYLCNMVSELKTVKISFLIIKCLERIIISLFSILMILPLILPIFCFLLVRLIQIKGKRSS